VRVIDFHQHLWPEALIELLARRDRPPRVRGSSLELAGEQESQVDPGAHELEARLALLDRWEIDVAVVSLQPTLGLTVLSEDERSEIAAAYESGILELAKAAPGRIVPLAAGPELDGFAGTCVGAPELMDLERLASKLDELVRREALLFVHPGPARAPMGAPAWWAAVVEYTAQMQAAHAVWLAEGAARWPALRVVFALLAGGAPFQLERLRSRGVSGRDVIHQNVFFETSSYGNRALELCLATFGVSQLVFGTDVPVLDPEPGLDAVRGFGDAVADALCEQNPARLLGSKD
jgi:6-methylsalicylate decarboxylase